MDNANGNNEFFMELARHAKYTNINNTIQNRQYNRFVKLFGNGKECNMLLLLRILDAYVMFVSSNPSLYNTVLKHSFVHNFIFDMRFWNRVVQFLSANTTTIYDTEHVEAEDDVKYLIESVETGDANYTETRKDVGNCENSKEYEGSFDSDSNASFQQLSPQNRILHLKNFFDLHFYRMGCWEYYDCHITYDGNYHIIIDELDEFTINSWSNKVSLPMNEQAYQFIDEIMSNIPNGFYVEKEYWTSNRKRLFRNYINNFDLWKFFQRKNYTKCYIRYMPQYGAGYVWDIDTDIPINSEPENDIIKQIVYLGGNNGIIRSNNTDKRYCLNVCFNKPKKKSKKPKQNLIKAYLRYFTMNSPEVLDALALDYVNSILCWDFHHKNTIVSGDTDKLYKWLNLFGGMQMAATGLIMFYLYVDTENGSAGNVPPCVIENCIDKTQKDLETIIKRFSEGANFSRFNQRYFLLNRNAEIGKKYEQLVNAIDFPYGGEFYELEELSDIDRLEIVKLLIVHGWHLLNSKTFEKKSLSSKNEDVFFDNLIQTDEARIPLSILHQIYSRFVNSGKKDSDLRMTLQSKGFIYDSFAVRIQDKNYLNELVKQAEKHYLTLIIKSTPKQRTVSCKLNPKFWDEISPAIKKDNELKQAAEFDLYLETLTEKYKKFYDVEIPGQEQYENPLKGFKKPEDISDDELQ